MSELKPYTVKLVLIAYKYIVVFPDFEGKLCTNNCKCITIALRLASVWKQTFKSHSIIITIGLQTSN